MEIAQHLEAVRARIVAACDKAGRDPRDVRLVAVSKTRPVADIEAAFAAGQRDFGENRVQELAEKAQRLAGRGLRWAMIGHVQTNKAADVARYADEVQSLDSLRLAQALHRRLDDLGRTVKVMVQVNTSGEASKSGLAPDEVAAFVRELGSYPRLEPVGLMTIAVLSDDAGTVAGCFRSLARLRTEVQDITGRPWPELSMGMSGDLETAIAEGSTCVRVGTAVFGVRS